MAIQFKYAADRLTIEVDLKEIRDIVVPFLGSLVESQVDKILQAKAQAEENEKLLSPKETVKLFTPPITRQTLASWTKSGKIPCKRIGKFIYYRKGDVIEAVNKIKSIRHGN